MEKEKINEIKSYLINVMPFASTNIEKQMIIDIIKIINK